MVRDFTTLALSRVRVGVRQVSCPTVLLRPRRDKLGSALPREEATCPESSRTMLR